MTARAAGFIVFLTSAAVLVLEILALRVLAPFVGVTLETYTAVIGVVLGGIALGASWGGRLADRIGPTKLIGPLLVAGGALALLTVPIVLFLGPVLHGGGELSSLVLAGAAFFPPAVALSAVPPAVVKLRLLDLEETGTVVGRLSALGTAGAIAGVFLTGFVLIATVPTKLIILIVGSALVVGGLATHRWLRGGPAELPGQDVRSYAALGVLGMVLTGISQAPCDVESAYYCAQIVFDEDDASRRTLILDTLTHSAVDIDDPTFLEFGYIRWFASAVNATVSQGQPINALHIGGGGFTMPRYFAATRPDVHNTVLEIDPALVKLAKEQLALETGPDLMVLYGDARRTIQKLPKASFNVVIGDAFSGLAVPWHLTTKEFVTQVRDLMTPTAIYAANIIDRPPFAFARAEAATFRSVFKHIALVTTTDRLTGRGGNLVLVASDVPLPERLSNDRDAVTLSGASLERWIGNPRVLTDDFAPVDQLLSIGRRSS